MRVMHRYLPYPGHPAIMCVRLVLEDAENFYSVMSLFSGACGPGSARSPSSFFFSRVARPYHLATTDDDGPAVELVGFVKSTPLTLPQLEFIFRQLDDGAFQVRVAWKYVCTNSSLTPPTAAPPPPPRPGGRALENPRPQGQVPGAR